MHNTLILKASETVKLVGWPPRPDTCGIFLRYTTSGRCVLAMDDGVEKVMHFTNVQCWPYLGEDRYTDE